MTIKSIRTGWNGISALAGNPVIGDFESIQTQTVSSGSAVSVEFTSIPNTYTHLQIRGISRSANANQGLDDILLTFNSDSGSNYARHSIYGDGSVTGAAASSSTTFINVGSGPRNNSTASTFGACIIDILDYTSTNKNKTVRSLFGTDLYGTSTGNGQVRLASGVWLNTNAITSIKLTAENTGFTQHSSFALYGIRG